MTTTDIPTIAIPAPLANELRIRAALAHEVLSQVVGRVAPAESESAGMLRLAREHTLFIAEALKECGGG